MIVDCAHYKDGARQDMGTLPLAEAARRRADDGFVWLGLHDPDPDELREVAERFDLPALAVEDAMQAHQRPKIEDYDRGYFLVLHTARYRDDEEVVEFGEVHVFTGPGHVVVVRHGAASELRDARERLEHNAELLREGPAAAVWAVMDKIVDDYEPVMAGLENDVEEVEV
ncbi:MAG: CorA family divalent cation transporter, partial [Solirubrobacteraceae bacterium]